MLTLGTVTIPTLIHSTVLLLLLLLLLLQMFKVNQDEQDDPECPKIMVLKDFIIETPTYYTFLESL